jgi:hypothetical protein
MRFQLCDCGKHPFPHGNFFDENGHYIKDLGGLVHLSGDLFSRKDVFQFLKEKHGFSQEDIDQMHWTDTVQIAMLPYEHKPGFDAYQQYAQEREIVSGDDLLLLEKFRAIVSSFPATAPVV